MLPIDEQSFLQLLDTCEASPSEVNCPLFDLAGKITKAWNACPHCGSVRLGGGGGVFGGCATHRPDSGAQTENAKAQVQHGPEGAQ